MIPPNIEALHQRYAQFFTNIGWNWEYKPRVNSDWQPTFRIHGNAPLLVDIGNHVTEQDFKFTAEFVKTNPSGEDADVLILGHMPWTTALGDGPFTNMLVAGYIGEYAHLCDPITLEFGTTKDYWWDPAQWSASRHPDTGLYDVGVFHPYASYHHRPSGQYDGDGHLNDANSTIISAWDASTRLPLPTLR